jgi:hypothetical protein
MRLRTLVFALLALVGLAVLAPAPAHAHGADRGARQMAACAMAQVETPFCQRMRDENIKYLTESYFHNATQEAGMAACLADGFSQRDCTVGYAFAQEGGKSAENRTLGIFLLVLFGGIALLFFFLTRLR